MSSAEFRAFEFPSPACEAARELIHGFIENRLSVVQIAKLRLHLKGCAPCHAEYVQLMHSVAELGRGLKAVRELSGHQQRAAPFATAGREHVSTDVNNEGFLARGRKRRLVRGGGLVVGLGAACVLTATCWPDPPVRALEARALDGRVAIPGQAALNSGERIDWTRGQRCDVPAGGKASVSSPTGSVELVGPALLLLEAPDPVRVRLEAGQALLDGTVMLTHGSAVVCIEHSKACASVREDALVVECLDGVATLTTADGTLKLRAGETARAASNGALERVSAPEH